MQGDKTLNSRDVTTPDTLMDLIRQVVPPNLIQATMQQYRTALIKPECRDDNCSAYFEDDGQWRDPNDTLTWKFKGEWTDGSNILGLVFFAIILGVALANIGEKGKHLLNFFSSLADAMMTITTWVIYLAPIGVFFLIGGQVLGTNDFGTVLNQLGWYFSTVLLGTINISYLIMQYPHSLAIKLNYLRSIRPRIYRVTNNLHSGYQNSSIQVHRQHDQCFHHSLWNRLQQRHLARDHQPAGDKEQGGPQGVQVRVAHRGHY